MRRVAVIWPLILLFAMFGCKEKKSEKKTLVERVKPKIEIPSFNQDSAYQFIAAQLAFGPRVPNTSGHTQCAAFLSEKLRTYTPSVYVQDAKVRAFDGTILNIKNIIASFNAEKQNRVFLAAHWDSRPFADHDKDPSKRNQPIPGANDGASGVGVLLEIARVIQKNPPSVGIDIILFDAEDYGPHDDSQQASENEDWGLGSQYWSRNTHIPGYRARYGILLDMVGAANARFPHEGFSRMYAPDILKKVWGTAKMLGYGDFFIDQPGAYINDDHYYVNTIRKIPTIDIIHLDPSSSNGTFFEQWHTMDDDLDIIDPFTLKVVGETVLKVIYEE